MEGECHRPNRMDLRQSSRILSLEQRSVVAHPRASIIDKDQGLSTTCQDGTEGSQGFDKEYLSLY